MQKVRKLRKITIGILIGIAVFLIAWDIWVYLEPAPGDTISEIFLYTSKHPVLPFAWGVLAGHFFWPQIRKVKADVN